MQNESFLIIQGGFNSPLINLGFTSIIGPLCFLKEIKAHDFYGHTGIAEVAH